VASGKNCGQGELMPESGKGSRGPKSTALTTPEAYPTTAPQLPSGDYSYTLEVVMGMQKTLGELTQAVRGLTSQVEKQGEKIDASCADIHAAKVVVRVLLALFVAAATFAGFIGKSALDYFSRLPAK
jgi:hypothetical protein